MPDCGYRRRQKRCGQRICGGLTAPAPVNSRTGANGGGHTNFGGAFSGGDARTGFGDREDGGAGDLAGWETMLRERRREV